MALKETELHRPLLAPHIDPTLIGAPTNCFVMLQDLQVDCTTSQSEEKKTCRRKASNPVRSALQ